MVCGAEEKKNILHIITKLELGGAQKNALDILRHLDNTKSNKFLITSSGILTVDALSIPELKIKFLPFLKRQINPLFDCIAFLEIIFFIKKNHIDTVHTHSSKAGIVGRWAAWCSGAKNIIHTVHGWSFNDYQNAITRKICILLEKVTAIITDKIVVLTSYDMEKGEEHGIGTREKYRLVPYGIEIEKMKGICADKNSIKNALGIPSNHHVVGMVACFKPQKSPLDFVRAASVVTKEMPDTTFLMVGDGVLRKKIDRLRKDLHLNDKLLLLGWRRDVPELLQIFDVLVLTSLWEGLPYVILEALASERPLPVVANDVCGIGEIVKEERTGLLSRPKDYNGLAGKITRLLKDKGLREHICREAPKVLERKYHLDHMLSEINKLYYTQEKALAGRA